MNFFKKAQLEITGMAKDGDTYVFSNSDICRSKWPHIVKKGVRERVATVEILSNAIADLNDFDFETPVNLIIKDTDEIRIGNAKNVKKLTAYGRSISAGGSELEEAVCKKPIWEDCFYTHTRSHVDLSYTRNLRSVYIEQNSLNTEKSSIIPGNIKAPDATVVVLPDSSSISPNGKKNFSQPRY